MAPNSQSYFGFTYPSIGYFFLLEEMYILIETFLSVFVFFMPIFPTNPLSMMTSSFMSRKKSLLISQLGAKGGLDRFSVMQTLTADVDLRFMFIFLELACNCSTIESKGAIKN